MAPVIIPAPYDLKHAISANRLAGLWHMLTGYRWLYVAATASLAVAALAKTSTYLLLRHFVDNVLGKNAALATLALMGLASSAWRWSKAASRSSAAGWLRCRPRGSRCGCAPTCSITSSG